MDNKIFFQTFTLKNKKLNWINEIQSCITFDNEKQISIFDMLKEILLKNDIPLTYRNIEKIKYEFVKFYKSNNTLISIERASEIFLNSIEKKFLPQLNDYWISHFTIDKKVWEICDKSEKNLFNDFITKANLLINNIKQEYNPDIVCICGSSKICDLISVVKWELEKKGIIAYGLHLLPEWYIKNKDWTRNHHGAEEENVSNILDDLHLKKINKSDVILIMNYDNYIGNRTKEEIKYAIKKNKPVLYWEK